MLFKIAIIFLAVVGILLLAVNCRGARPDTLGVEKGRLTPCPDTPNCVSTQADSSDSEHRMEPVSYSGSLEEVRQKILTVIGKMERAKIITATENYIHVEFTSKVMKFVDDVEFFIDDRAKLIHFRSASRVGRSDLGVNRERMERFIKLFTEKE